VGILLAFWIISNSVIILFRKKENLSNGMIIAHLGIGLLILGITGSSVWQEEKITQMKIGNETNIQEYNIILKEINEIKGPNYLALQGNFFVYDKNKNIIAKLKPENRFYPIRNNFTTEASIHTNLLRDLYIVLGEGNLNDGWVVRIYYNPLVIWIWIGALTIFLGGIVSMNSNLKKLQRLS
jgi:cytochrome c-type biogenesis protein CcmF